MRRIKKGATTDTVKLGEVIEYDTGDGVYHKIVAVPKKEFAGCDGCYFDGPYTDNICVVYYMQNGIRREMTLCCLYPGEVVPSGNKFCKFIKTVDIMEEL